MREISYSTAIAMTCVAGLNSPVPATRGIFAVRQDERVFKRCAGLLTTVKHVVAVKVAVERNFTDDPDWIQLRNDRQPIFV
jgi:hypothetical protein